MGVPARFTIDLKSCTNNDKDLTHNISNKNINPKFPVYVQNYIKQYVCLLGLHNDFGHLHKFFDYADLRKGSLKKQEKYLNSICYHIKKYGEAVKSGFFKDLSEEELPHDVFINIEHIELSLEEFLERYLVPCTEDDDEYEYDDCIYKLDKQKYENNVDKDYPGLRKLIDTLKLYNETIKYERKYNITPPSSTVSSSNISYSSDDDSDDDSEVDFKHDSDLYSDSSDSDSDSD